MAETDLAELERLCVRRAQAKRDGLPGAVLGFEIELAREVPALIARVKAAERALRLAQVELRRFPSNVYGALSAISAALPT